MRSLVLGCVFFLGCAAETGGDACLVADEPCSATSELCCPGSICIQPDVGQAHCADECTEGSGCLSGCCDTLSNAAARVCAAPSFCLTTFGETCETIASTLCARDRECGFRSPTCLADVTEACCENSGCPNVRPSTTLPELTACLSALRVRACSSTTLPAACVGVVY